MTEADPGQASGRATHDYDSPWKEVIDQQLRDVLAFCFPDVHEAIDSLEQELRKLAPAGETGKRLADKLVKVRTRTGDDNYLHVEVQGERQAGFERRVYVYHYRADDRFGLPAEELVLLADDDPDWQQVARHEQEKQVPFITWA
jgi:hypothetical protein